MKFDIGDAIRNGIRRGIERNGLILMGVFVAISLVASVFAADFFARVFSHLDDGELLRAFEAGFVSSNPAYGNDATEPLVGLPMPVAGLGWALAMVASLVANVAGMGTFVSDETERIPKTYATRNIAWVVGNLIVGGIVVSVIVGIGTVFLILPGIFLAVSLYFWNFVVVVDDESFVTGARRSWGLTSGHRFSLFLLGLIVLVAGGIVGWVVSAISGALPQPVAILVVTGVNQPIGLLSTAIAAQAFRQVRRDPGSAET
jgi:hypothetical protein